MLRANLEFLMFQTNKIPFRAPTHTHTCVEVVYYIKGTGITYINGEAYAYEPNTFSIIEPQQIHNEVAETETDIIYIGFTYGSSAAQLVSGVYHDNEKCDILTLFNTMCDEMIGKYSYYNDRLHLLTQEILIIIERILFSNNKDENNIRLSNAINYFCNLS